MQQVKIGLTEKQRGALEGAAKKNGRTLSEEVRLRLASSLLEDEFGDFARVAGREVAIMAEIVTLSAVGNKTDVDVPSEAERAKIRSTMWRAMVVAVHDYFAEIKPRQFSAKPLVPPPTEPDVRADAIGHAAAQALLVWASGETVLPDNPTSWLFDVRNSMENSKAGKKP